MLNVEGKSMRPKLIPAELAQAVADGRAILFAGAGLSMTVGLPSWAELIEHMAREVGIENSAAHDRNYTHNTLAEYYQLKRGSIGPLRSWMERKWKVSDRELRDSEVHKLVIQLG